MKIKSALLHLIEHLITAKKLKKVLIGEIFADAVTYIEIFQSIVIEVEAQSSPAPACCINPGELRNFTKCTIAIIELQTICCKLMMKVALQTGILHIVVIKLYSCLQLVITFWQHLGSEHIKQSIVINIYHV